MKPGKKAQKKLERRQRGHASLEADVKIMGRQFDARGYTAPGSRNRKRG